MDLVTLVTACALAVDPKLIHALVWHQSGGEPWAVAAQGDASPRVYQNMRDVIRDAREMSGNSVVRVGLAGVPVSPPKVSPGNLLPCRNIAMAATQLTKLVQRCKTHPRGKADLNLCSIAVYRGTWERPDFRFATDVTATAAKGDAPNFDMPRGTSTEMFDVAEDIQSPSEASVVDITATFADQARGWSSALFPSKPNANAIETERSATVNPPPAEQAPATSFRPSNIERKGQDRELFVRRSNGAPAR